MNFDLQMAIYGATIAFNLALAVAVGAVIAALWLPNGETAWPASQRRKIRSAGTGAILSALVALGALLPFVSAVMAEVPVAESTEAMVAMLTESHFGMAWKFGMGALLAALLVAAVPASGQWRRGVAILNLLPLVIVLYTRSMVSHAAADGDLSVAVIIDWLHLCLMAVWVGAVVIAAFATLTPGLPTEAADRLAMAGYVDSLSSCATFALVGIVATGLFSGWHNLGTIDSLTSHAYGNLLLLKLALVSFAVLLGGCNRFIVMPTLLTGLREGGEAADPLRRFSLILRIEAGVLLAVLVAAAVLSATSPP